MLKMNRKRKVACGVAVLAGIGGAAAGCEDAAKKPVQARIPATTPAPQTAGTATRAPGPVQLPPLPLTAASHPLLLWKPPISGSKDELIAKVEEKFSSGQQ